MREIRALVTVGGRYAGEAEPFAVDSPWWNDVEPVTAHLDRVLGVPTSVLRLVATATSGTRDGVVTYQVEAERVPDGGLTRSADPDLAPAVRAAEPGRVLPADAPRVDCRLPDAEVVERVVENDPASALRHARPASHLVGARVYQEFLDHVEPSERVYHLGNPEAEPARAQSFEV
ncbi:hypothetical protein [Saccharothrix hoggarensis]|uniref:Uncharacterized protein n=1 Tax=Saccharothrix hoggarensis TaxID=913853 RepID=A0ABW3QPN9_9PSEU